MNIDKEAIHLGLHTHNGQNGEDDYRGICRALLACKDIKDNRTGDPCFTLPPQTINHDMSKGFPLITSKKMGLKTIATELQFFIGGLTDKQWLKDRKCNIWNEWCNPMVIEELKAVDLKYIKDALQNIEEEYGVKASAVVEKYEELIKEEEVIENEYVNRDIWVKAAQCVCNDLGPVYGYQWRAFNFEYIDGQVVSQPFMPPTVGKELASGDQLAYIVRTLKENPNDRRMVCSAWNPLQQHQQALPPCHVSWNVQHINGVLHLEWYQR